MINYWGVIDLTNSTNKICGYILKNKEINAIKKLLTAQQACWNNGDID